MEATKIQEKVNELIEKTVNEVFARMSEFPVCEKFYYEIAKVKPEAAIAFKNICFCTSYLHPDWSDEQIFNDFVKNTGILN